MREDGVDPRVDVGVILIGEEVVGIEELEVYGGEFVVVVLRLRIGGPGAGVSAGL